MSTSAQCEDRFDQPSAQLIGYVASVKVCASSKQVLHHIRHETCSCPTHPGRASGCWLQGDGFLRTLRRCRSTKGALRYSLTEACPTETPFDGILGYVR